MARERKSEPRFDVRGGVNSSFSPDVLDLSEVRRSKNGRSLLGEIEKRAGSQRIHVTPIGAAGTITGLFQWDPAAGLEVVALSAGNLYHKLSADAEFTAVASAFSLVNKASFAAYRTGATIKLLIADGTLHTWDDAAIVAVAGAPAAKKIVEYKLRMYALDGTKTLYASKVGDPTLWGAANAGFSADVETFDSEPLVGAIVIGGSLLLCKADNIARFTGVDTNNIRIDVETQGVSSEVGLIAADTLVKFDEIAFLLTSRGPYVASEAGVREIGLKVSSEFDFANKALWQAAEAVHHRYRKEIWLSLPASGENGNLTTWVWNYRTDAWSGPFVFPFPLAAIARYVRSDGTESIISGGIDGLVRELDVIAVNAKDDVLRDGTLGTNVVLDVTYPDLVGGRPGQIKSLRSTNRVEADLKTAGSLEAYWSSELSAGSSVFMASKGAGVKNYLYKFANAKGTRIIYGLRDSTAEIVKIVGHIPDYAYSREGR